MLLLLIVGSSFSLSACHMTLSTPSGLREHHRGINGGLSVAKSKNDGKEEYHQTQRETDYNALHELAARMAEEAGS